MCHARYDGCCRIVVDQNTCTNYDVNVDFDITELLRDRRTDEWKSGHLCRKVRRSGRYFIQGLMVV